MEWNVQTAIIAMGLAADENSTSFHWDSEDDNDDEWLGAFASGENFSRPPEKLVDDLSSRKMPKVAKKTTTKSRSDDQSTKKAKRPRNASVVKKKLCQIVNESSMERMNVDDRRETQASNSTTRFDVIEDSGFHEYRSTCEKKTETNEQVKSNTISSYRNYNGKKRRCETTSPERKEFKAKKTNEQNGGKSLLPRVALDSLDDEDDSQASSCSTYFSGAENFSTNRYNLETESGPFMGVDSLRLIAPEVSTSAPLTNIGGINDGPMYFIRLVLQALADESLTAEYTTTSQWHGTILKKAVDAYVGLAESTCAVEAAQLCVREAVKLIENTWKNFLQCSNSLEFSMDVQWMNHFTILFTLCDSKRIREKLLEFFINHMITPKITVDSDDPEEIIEDSIEHDRARFGLIRMHELLTKYAQNVKNACENNATSAERQKITSVDLWSRIQARKDQPGMEWIIKLERYAAENVTKFPLLASIAAQNVTLLKESLSLRKPP